MDYDQDNIFAKILRGEIPSPRVYEDDEFIVIRDVNPQAPTHLLVIPKGVDGEAATGPGALQDADAPWAGRMLVLAARIAREQGLAEDGYRLVLNHGEHGGQTIPHLHLHILGGHPLASLG